MSRLARFGAYSLDHVLVAGAELDPMIEWASDLGMAPEYGGVHGNGVTHNAVIGFDDGSYVELIALYDPDSTAPRRDSLLRSNVGPCGWAIEVTDMANAVDQLRNAGIAVNEPMDLSRERPDGGTVAFAIATVGQGEPGTIYPFLIADRTPRTARITATDSVTNSELAGVVRVVLGVDDRERWGHSFRTAFSLPSPRMTSSDALGVDLAWFPDSALVLAEPKQEKSEVRSRLERFGPLPCAHLIATRAFEESLVRGSASWTVEQWADHRVGLYPIDSTPIGGRIGLIESPH